MKYLIENITFKNGNTRTDGKYPYRIGSIVEIQSDIIIGYPLYFKYIKYNNEEIAENHITRTSRVDDFDFYSHPGYLLIYTRNSVYHFKEMEE